ncbi:hypothetical protein KSP40_PGU015045 [Platanthera guangdongensis]|uniref:Tyrosine specific protein phosphatases domain-containing protein n=1 Tax=Platanthera guangdongensis TaxID=2320717 RepID=A0ABR2M050_9ASPA
MNYTVISDDIIVGSQPQKPEDIYHLMDEKVAYILSLQQDKDIEYWDIDIDAIVKICNKLESATYGKKILRVGKQERTCGKQNLRPSKKNLRVCYNDKLEKIPQTSDQRTAENGSCRERDLPRFSGKSRQRPAMSAARDFDPNSLRSQLPKAVSSLEWAISDGKGRVYVHCTAGLGRAPAVAIAYMFWFCNTNLDSAYGVLTSKRPCGPNKTAIRGATYDLAKNNPWKEPFESLPEYAFNDIAGWERKLIQDRVRELRGT